MLVVTSVQVLLFWNYFVVVLALAHADVLVRQNLIGQIVVIDDLDQNAAENYQDAQPLHLSQVMTVPSYVDADC